MLQLIFSSRIVAAAILLSASPAITATFTVTNTQDAGAGSLRQAFDDANKAGGDNTIVFDLPGVADPVIKLTTNAAYARTTITVLNDRPGDVPVTIQVDPPQHFGYPCFYVEKGGRLLLAGLTLRGPPGGTYNQQRGVYNYEGSVALRNCALIDNNNIFGGGLYSYNGEASL